MNILGKKIDRIVEASREGKPLVHEWKREEIGSAWAFFSERLRAKLGLSGALNLSDTEVAMEIFDKIEEMPVFKEAKVQGIEREQLTAMVCLGESMLTSLHSRGDPMAYQLARRLVALRYRLSLSEIGLSREDEEPLPMNLYLIASQWKSRQEHFDNKILSNEDHRLLRNLSYYRHFIPFLEEDLQMREDFFNWVIRDHLDPAVFIEFPAIQEKITRANLQIRLGRQGGRGLYVVRDQVTEVMMPIEGEEVNIVNPLKTITLKGNYKLSINDMFEIFENKKIAPGNLEFMSDGVVNWEAYKLGYWNNDLGEHTLIDLEKPRWWEQMPAFERLSLKQLTSRYHVQVPSGAWVVVLHGTREHLTLNYNKTHAFLEVMIPQGDGSFSVYAIGKYGTELPTTFIETVAAFCDVMPGAISFPDENVFYSHRQHGSYATVLTRVEGEKLMAKIGQDIRLAREGNLVYQIESENCAKWAIETVHTIKEDVNLHSLMKIHLLETEVEGPIGKIFGLIKKLPGKIQSWVLTRAHYLLGAWQGRWIKKDGIMTWMSLSAFEFFDTAVIYLPALLVKQIHEGAAFALNSLAPTVISWIRGYSLHWARTMNAKAELLKRARNCFWIEICLDRSRLLS